MMELDVFWVQIDKYFDTYSTQKVPKNYFQNVKNLCELWFISNSYGSLLKAILLA